jgi:hypothetical protein
VEKEVWTQHLLARPGAISAVEEEQQSTRALAAPAWHANELCAAFRAGGAGALAGDDVYVLLVTGCTAHNEPPVETAADCE